MKLVRFTLLLSLSALVQSVVGQSADSIAVVSNHWKVTPVAKGVVWKHGHFEHLFGSPQDVNLVEIDLKKYRKKIRIAADAARLDSTSLMATAHGALAAINGGFFDMKNGGSVDFIKVDKQVINPTREPSDRANAVLLISRRKVEIKRTADPDNTFADIPSVMLSGPLLVQEGASVELSSNPFNDNRHPRSAIAITGNNKLLLVVVDGRSSLSAGMSLPELRQTLRWLGADDAMNLDGGGSSTLYVKGATQNGVVNHPSDNKRFDHVGQRRVANIIYLAD